MEVNFDISFVTAPPQLLKAADEILKATIRTNESNRRTIRAVAKAYIDETEEMVRAARQVQARNTHAQIETISPPEMIEKAKSIQEFQLPNKELEKKIREVATSYVLIATKNQELLDEFEVKYKDVLPYLKRRGQPGTESKEGG